MICVFLFVSEQSRQGESVLTMRIPGPLAGLKTQGLMIPDDGNYRQLVGRRIHDVDTCLITALAGWSAS